MALATALPAFSTGCCSQPESGSVRGGASRTGLVARPTLPVARVGRVTVEELKQWRSDPGRLALEILRRDDYIEALEESGQWERTTRK